MHLMKCNKPDWREKPPGFFIRELATDSGAEASNEHRICFLKNRPVVLKSNFNFLLKLVLLYVTIFLPHPLPTASKKDLHFNQV